MGETPRRSGFRLPWGESSDATPATSEAGEAAAEDAAPNDSTSRRPEASATASSGMDTAPSPAPAATDSTESSQFLRELVDAMRGVAESSRDTNLGELRTTLDRRIEELRAAAAQRAEDLRHRSEQDIVSVGEWEQSEIDRIRSEAEQRRDARRAKLERELKEHQVAADGEVEATRRKLTEYEGKLGSFFAELAEIRDPAAFVAAAKRMPPPPDLGVAATTADSTDASAGATDSESDSAAAAAADAAAATANEALAQRLAQLDQRLTGTAGTDTSAEAAGSADAAAVAPAADATQPGPEAATEAEATETVAGEPAAAPTADASTNGAAKPEPAADAVGGESSTPIVVKGLGSFGAITSFKQALERVDGVHGVTLSLGPTGEFVYRASHAAEFDIIGAIRSIEGQAAGIEESEGSVLVTIERQR